MANINAQQARQELARRELAKRNATPQTAGADDIIGNERMDELSADPKAPLIGAKGPDTSATGMDRVQATAAGVNKGIAGTAGLPVDTAVNVWDLGKAAVGSLQGAVTGNAPSPAFDPADRSQIPGSSQFLENALNGAGVFTEAARPDDTASRYLHAAGTGVPAAMTGGGGGANMVRQGVSGVLSGVVGQGAADAGLDPGAQAVLATAAGGGAAAAKVPRKGPKLQPYEAKTDTQRARAIDQKLLPSEVGDSPVGTVLEGMAGSQNVRRHMNKKNEATNTKLAAKVVGADPNNMGKKSMDKLKENEGAAYQGMRALGKITPDGAVHADIGALNADKSTVKNPAIAKAIQDELLSLEGPVDAGQLVERVKELRQQSSFNQSPPQGVGSKPDPKKVELGKTQKKIADALDGMLERTATTMGQPETAKQYRESRTKIAKINSVENATVGRKVQASELAKQGARDVPLSQELGLIADAGEAFPHSTSRPVVGTETLSDTNWLQNIVAPVISRVLASDTYQNNFGRKTAMGPASPVNEYFDDPNKPEFHPRGPGVQDELPPPTGRAPIEANRLAGDLELEGQGVAPMQRDLDASIPPRTADDGVPFTPPNGTGQAPNIDLASLLGLADDVSPRQSLPAPPRVNDTGLELQDATRGLPDRTRAARSTDTVDFEPPTGQEPYQPFKGGERFTQSLNPRTEQPTGFGRAADFTAESGLALEPEGTARGRSFENAGLADDLELVPDNFRRETSAPELGADNGGEPLDERFGMPPPKRVTAGTGYISYIPGGDKVRQITGAFVKPGDRGKGAGQANLLKLVDDSSTAGETLNSDASVSHDQLKVYDKLRKAGTLDFEVNEKAFKAALDGKKPLKGSQPVIKNIRRPDEVDVTS